MPASMTRIPRTLLVVAALAVLALVPAGSTAAGPSAHAAKSCGTGSGRGLGPTYAYKLTVSHTSCRNGRKLIRAYNTCRHHHGGKRGHCSGVLGYHCSQRILDKSSVQFDARVRCKKGGGRRINHVYTQNL
jgi:hypothetical protein